MLPPAAAGAACGAGVPESATAPGIAGSFSFGTRYDATSARRQEPSISAIAAAARRGRRIAMEPKFIPARPRNFKPFQPTISHALRTDKVGVATRVAPRFSE